MEVIFSVSEDILIAGIKGEVDHHSAAPLRNTIDRSMKAFGCKHLVLDFAGVQFMDSSGIGVVLGRYKKLVKSGGSVCISGCSSYIKKVLEMADVFSIIPNAADTGSAIERIKGREQLRMEVL